VELQNTQKENVTKNSTMKEYVYELLDQIEQCKHEVRFTSSSTALENYLINLFFDNRIYAIQFHENTFAISKVSKEVESLNYPEKSFQSWNDLHTELENIFNK
jgi:hypothetical protein